jgi:hypothetical protein
MLRYQLPFGQNPFIPILFYFRPHFPAVAMLKTAATLRNPNWHEKTRCGHPVITDTDISQFFAKMRIADLRHRRVQSPDLGIRKSLADYQLLPILMLAYRLPGKLTILPFPLFPCLLGGKTGENNLRAGIWRLFGLVSLTGIF